MDNAKKVLHKWQDKLDRNLQAYAGELDKMDARELQYKGGHALRPLVENGIDEPTETPHVWNITSENIESEIDNSMPTGKVTPSRQQDNLLGKMIEAMLLDELDRLPAERINDRAERTCKVQGGVLYLVEWDSAQRTHTTVGENSITVLHPKRYIPQDGVEEPEDMDYMFLRMPQTKGYVKRRYGVDVSDETEEDASLRGEEASTAEDLVTLETAYYRNEHGGVGRIVWVGDTVCEELEDCQSRRLRRCKKCGQTEADSSNWKMVGPTVNGEYPQGLPPERRRKDACAYCGARSWEETDEEGRWMTIADLREKGVREDVLNRLQGMAAPEPAAAEPEFTPDETAMSAAGSLTPEAESGAETILGPETLPPYNTQTQAETEYWVPYYRPNIYPVVLQRNVTAWGTFLGESDCDKIRDQQNTVNHLSRKMITRISKWGTKIAMPDNPGLRMDGQDQELWYMPQSDLAQVKQFDFTGDLEWPYAYLNHVYEESRRILGITDSFQGRTDTTATSGKAKEFSAAQAAGRIESKKIMKKAAWAEIFERLFRNKLAYCEERRKMHGKNEMDTEWNSWAFLECDEAGELYWNDQFRFSCDNASGLAANREAMWQEITQHLQSGAYGNPSEPQTLIRYWAQMEMQNYPGAGTIKKLLEEQAAQQQAQAMAMQSQQAMQQQMGMPQGMQ